MKKKFLIGLIALLSVSLFFLGCPTEADDDEEVKTSVPAFALTSGQPGLSLTFAQGDDPGVYTLTVTGTVAPANVSDAGWIGTWGTKPTSVTGNFAAVSINFNAVFTAENVAKILGIRNESQALRYYTGYNGSSVGNFALLTEEPSNPIEHGDLRSTIYIPTDTATPVRWAAYAAGKIPENDNMQVLIWSGTTSKTSKFEFSSWTSINSETHLAQTTIDDDIATIIVDYSGVTIGE
jgi:hypothetical protein